MPAEKRKDRKRGTEKRGERDVSYNVPNEKKRTHTRRMKSEEKKTARRKTNLKTETGRRAKTDKTNETFGRR